MKKKKLKINISDQHKTLSCCSCRNPISITADFCPRCGCQGPFYFKVVWDEYKGKFDLGCMGFLLGVILFFLPPFLFTWFKLNNSKSLFWSILPYGLGVLLVTASVLIFNRKVEQYIPYSKISYLCDTDNKRLWESYMDIIKNSFKLTNPFFD